MSSTLRPALSLLALFTLLTGVAYPAAVTGLAQLIFPRQAGGSLIEVNGKLVGSSLIGQPFTGDKYFWARPSATGAFPYDASASSGSNAGPLSSALKDAVAGRVATATTALGAKSDVPVDLVTTSGSGLDPHITPAGALYQIERVAKARGVGAEQVRRLVDKHTQGRSLSIFGEPRVNVVELNLDLDATITRR